MKHSDPVNGSAVFQTVLSAVIVAWLLWTSSEIVTLLTRQASIEGSCSCAKTAQSERKENIPIESDMDLFHSVFKFLERKEKL
jgi:hypothetical protein